MTPSTQPSDYSSLGEVGLDRAFRVPWPPTIYPKRRSPLATPLHHQLQVVEAQIDIAIRLRRNISFHSVRASQDTVDLLNRLKTRSDWEAINVCLHSFGGSPQTATQILKCEQLALLLVSL